MSDQAKKILTRVLNLRMYGETKTETWQQVDVMIEHYLRAPDIGFWDRLGHDEGLMPKHLPMAVNSEGQGPENDADAHHYECWCPDSECALTKALKSAWDVGVRIGYEP